MAKKIELSELEKTVIQKQLNGEIQAFVNTEEERKVLTKIVADAEALLEEEDAYEEMGDDMILWYWNRYKAQESNA